MKSTPSSSTATIMEGSPVHFFQASWTWTSAPAIDLPTRSPASLTENMVPLLTKSHWYARYGSSNTPAFVITVPAENGIALRLLWRFIVLLSSTCCTSPRAESLFATSSSVNSSLKRTTYHRCSPALRVASSERLSLGKTLST